MVCMNKTLTADGMFTGTPAQALAYAREHGIKGSLIKRTRTRELRSYKLDRGPVWKIFATASEHVS